VNTDAAAAQRNTKQRSAVSAVLAEAEGFNSEIDVMRPPGGEHLYRRCSQGHHHHLVCRSCGRAVEVEGPAVESWADKVAGQHGFVDVSHTMEIFGTCPDCAGKR
jgi:Fur family transcriptional regulator, ferric uptake regulator